MRPTSPEPRPGHNGPIRDISDTVTETAEVLFDVLCCGHKVRVERSQYADRTYRRCPYCPPVSWGHNQRAAVIRNTLGEMALKDAHRHSTIDYYVYFLAKRWNGSKEELIKYVRSHPPAKGV